MGVGTYERKQFVGGAPATTITGSLSDSATTTTLDSATGWPDATNPFVAIIDRGLATEEKVLVNGRTGVNLSGMERGYDDTTAQAHSSGATIEHGLDASTIDQANRLANLQDAQGEIIAHNGTNPVAVAAGGTNDHVLLVDSGEAGGVKFGLLNTVADAGTAPTVSGVQRVWFDSATGLVRLSDGTNWEYTTGAPAFASEGARDTYFGDPPTQDGVACFVGTGTSLQYQVWDGTNWVRIPRLDEGIPKFADDTTRDLFYTSPATGDHAFLIDVDQLTEYREDEWILLNRKITTSESTPVDPHDGDIWLQPT